MQKIVQIMTTISGFFRAPTARLHFVIWAIIALGAALRLTIWLQDRSLFIDEANLLRNCIELPLSGLFQNLRYHQYAPPLFCAAEKGLFAIFGVHDRAARLLPLLAGIASLILYYRVARHYLSPAGVAMSLLFLALGEPFFRYGTEAKQYATDLLTTLVLLAIALNRPNADLRPPSALLLVVGAVAIWWSMPAVFVLAGIGAYHLVGALRADRKRAFLAPLAWCGLAWGLSFGAFYWLILRQDVHSSVLQSAHVFFEWPGLAPEAWIRLLDRVRGLGVTATGFTFFSNIAYWTGLLGGLYAVWRGRKPAYLLVVLPLLFCILASMLRFYAVTERLTLFFMPLLLILLGLGWEQLLRFGRPWIGVALSVILLAAALSRNPAAWFFRPFEVVEVRRALWYLRDHVQPGDRVYAHPDAGPSAYHYTRLAARPILLPNLEVSRGLPADELQDLQRRFPNVRIWIIWNAQDDVQAALGAARPVEKQAAFAGCAVWLAAVPGR